MMYPSSFACCPPSDRSRKHTGSASAGGLWILLFRADQRKLGTHDGIWPRRIPGIGRNIERSAGFHDLWSSESIYGLLKALFVSFFWLRSNQKSNSHIGSWKYKLPIVHLVTNFPFLMGASFLVWIFELQCSGFQCVHDLGEFIEVSDIFALLFWLQKVSTKENVKDRFSRVYLISYFLI